LEVGLVVVLAVLFQGTVVDVVLTSLAVITCIPPCEQ
jgi:hypothetical protein